VGIRPRDADDSEPPVLYARRNPSVTIPGNR